MLLPTSDLVEELGKDADLIKVVKLAPVVVGGRTDGVDVYEIVFWVVYLLEMTVIPLVVFTASEFAL